MRLPSDLPVRRSTASPMVIGFAAVVVAALFIPAILGMTIAEGFVISTLWRWFVVSVTGWHELSIARAIGIGLMLDMFKIVPEGNSLKGKKGSELASLIFSKTVGKWAVILGMGWIVMQFI